jgi:hypothetical protein
MGGNPEAGRRGTKAWYPDGAGSIDPAGGDAGSATQMGAPFSEHSPKAQQYIAEGHRRVVNLDFEKFFDRVNHDKLMTAIARLVTDERVLQLIGAFLKVGVLENGLVSPAEEAAQPSRFAITSPRSGCEEDFRLQAIEHGRHTKKGRPERIGTPFALPLPPPPE